MFEHKERWSVGAWMTHNPRTITPDTSVRAAFILMRSEGYRHLLVCDGDKLVGIVTDRDLRRPDISDDAEGWLDYYRLDDDYEVRYVMTGNVQTLRTRDGLDRAVHLFTDRKFGAVPVVDKNGDLIGILTTHDLLRALEEALHGLEAEETQTATADETPGA